MDQDGAAFTESRQAFTALRERKIFDLVMGEAAARGPGMSSQPITKDGLAEARHVSEPARDCVVRLIVGTRGDSELAAGVAKHLSHPVGRRGSILPLCAPPAPARLTRRDTVTPQDVVDLAPERPQSIRVV